MAPGWCPEGLKDPPTSPTPAETAIPLPAAGGTAGPGEVGAERCEGPGAAAPLRSAGGAVRGPACGSAPGHGGRCAAPVVGGGCWGGVGGGAAAAGGAEGGLAGGSGARRRRWWEAAGGSAGLAGPGDGGRGGLSGGQAAAAPVRGHRGLVLGLSPRGGGGGGGGGSGGRRRSRACAAHSGLAGRHGAGHERGGAPGSSGEWRSRRALEAGAARPAGGLPGGLCEGAVGWG